ncbi:2-C-methyl-D-erythritol 4-phosphate cytidylyltransferase [Anseongella ginsenosidimutans]|uniref:2-C-methyl-D-erythritol 4-phosphate cytidylyltransferase n=1 Tax=Anseongella ginsenosidimutans TaxID=496056 RepID=A0A4R3KMH7_9SPHI|nr:2-C-methyl-D-erythritol 4-phosphate cytidylyltransferase [Anseongella ginsenosidimutans]TCS85515.1 2-C-methyl-D-erythritol 4-phosphate cytidylyltransferase [Anseongella ginsenosidimutans]
MSRYAIIVGAGKGERMGSELPKQFLELKGLPVLMHTINRFHESAASDIILVLNVHFHSYWEKLCKEYNFNVPHLLVKGGVTRFDSVRKGLKEVTRKGTVAVHDAVRPLVSAGLILKCFEKAEELGNAVPAVPCRESLRKGGADSSQSLSRDDYFLVQTPQCFNSALLKRAYRQEFRNEFTDDASVVEKSGEPIHLVEGETSNIKITYPDDLKIAEALL